MRLADFNLSIKVQPNKMHIMTQVTDLNVKVTGQGQKKKMMMMKKKKKKKKKKNI